MYAAIEKKLVAKELVIIDGGTGTDIQRRGAPMHSQVWCAEANLTHPDVVEMVHADYIRAGADIITANTYATSPLLFNAIGRESALKRIDAIAVELAQDARRKTAGGRPVAVAGSFSTMRPVKAGSDQQDLDRNWSEADARRLLRAKADGLAEAGVDLIMMEMMRDTDYSVWAVEEAVATGLPVWVGLALQSGKDGRLTGQSRPDCSYDDMLAAFAGTGAKVMALMHTLAHEIDKALPVLQQRWQGPVAIYPESGHFEMPNWQFDATMTPDAFVGYCRNWHKAGAAALGGCCGIGPEHISALSAAKAKGKV